ncbi:MAG: class A beta-lactamase-related serine hydrolase [Desulfotalea sp.]
MILNKLHFSIYLSLFVLLFLPAKSFAKTYNIVYLISRDIEQALDYQEELESVLGDKYGREIRVTSKGKNRYAVIFDKDTAGSASEILLEQSKLLEKAGMDAPFTSTDNNFKTLYNVSYGMGPNIGALKKIYDKVYGTLGGDVGRHLFIEKTDRNNYKLIYRRRGDKKSTVVVARRHGRVLKSKRIKPTIAIENNNEVVFGESSLLNENDIVVVKKEDFSKDEIPKIIKIRPSDKVVYKKTVETTKPVEIVGNVIVSQAKEKTKIVKIYIQAQQLKFKKKSSKKSRKALILAANSKIEKSIEKKISFLRRKGKISKDEKTAWMVFDLASGVPVVDINANIKLQAASMIKPFVALAFFHKVKEGKIKYGSKSKRKLAAMIQRSNNSATNWVMKQVGGPKSCQRILKKHYPSIFKGTMITEYIPAGGRTYKNLASPSDYVRFLKGLWDKKLPYSNEMRRLMALPGRDRLYFGTPIPKGTLVYNKTGSTAHLCGDMGILVPKTKSGKGYPYVIVGVIQKSSKARNYGSWITSRSKVIRDVSTLVYKEMKQQHNLR